MKSPCSAATGVSFADVKQIDPPGKVGNAINPRSLRQSCREPAREPACREPVANLPVANLPVANLPVARTYTNLHANPHANFSLLMIKTSPRMADPHHQPMVVAPPGKSPLEALPHELLVMTFEALASGGPDLKDIVAYRAYTDSLRSLCLVSKSMEAVARPELYRDIRLYSHMAVVHLYAAFCSDPTLASSVRSVLFCMPRDSWRRDIRTIDLRALRPFPDPDYAFWTRGRSKAKIRMPQKTREELVCTLFSKALSRIPALECLYFRPPELRPIGPKCLEHLPDDAEFKQQLGLQARLFEDFCQGRSLSPNLARLSTVGMLEQEPGYDVHGLCETLIRSPNLHRVLCADFLHWTSSFIWNRTLEYSAQDSEYIPHYS